MINKNKKYLGAVIATLAVAGMVAAPQAMAKKAKKAKASTITEYHHSETTTRSSNGALESQLRALQDEVSKLRAQVNASAPSSRIAATVAADSQKVQELDAWANSLKAKHSEHHAKGHDDNLIFFRGGFARNDSKRHDVLTGDLSTALPSTDQGKTNQDGYYFGAGFDFGLTDNVWGLADKTDIMAELMFDYRNFGERNLGAQPLQSLVNTAALNTLSPVRGSVTVSQFTLGASPKIKFLKGSDFRPWIIPLGLTVNVISPPSNGVTVLNPGMQFGTGAEYAIWKAIKIGADVRYNLTGRSVDGVNTNGLTAGGYLGIGF